MRPDRIILGEVRGIEARTLLDSFNTGHEGSLATIHANSAAKALTRFANLVLRSHSQAAFADVEAEIGEAVDFVVHIEREPGRRVVREVLRLDGYDRTHAELPDGASLPIRSAADHRGDAPVRPMPNCSPLPAPATCVEPALDAGADALRLTREIARQPGFGYQRCPALGRCHFGSPLACLGVPARRCPHDA